MSSTDAPIQPVAFRLRSPEALAAQPLWGLPFPRHWRDGFTLLEQERTQRREVTFPIRSLNAVLQAFCDQLMCVPGQARPEAPGAAPIAWLLGRTAFPPDPLVLVVKAWCTETFADCPSLNFVLDALRAEDLRWQELTLPLHPMPTSYGTAKPAGLLFNAVPAVLADLLVQRQATIKVYGQSRQLVRVPSVDGAELVSWPPVYLTDKHGKRWAFSYTLNLTLQTLVGDPQPRLHVHYGVRRWVSQPLVEGTKVRLGSQARSVFLRVPGDGWLGLAPDAMFTRARLRTQYQEAGRVPVWADAIAGIAQRLGLQWPEAEHLAKNPLPYLREQGQNGLVAAIVEHHPRTHPVQPGMGLEEHEALTQIVYQHLAEELAFLPPLTSRLELRKPHHHPLEQNLRDVPQPQRQKAFVEAVGPQATIEVWWMTEAGRDMQIDRLQALLMTDRPPLVEADTGRDQHQNAPPDQSEENAEEEPEPEMYVLPLEGLEEEALNDSLEESPEAILELLEPTPSPIPGSERKRPRVRAAEPAPLPALAPVPLSLAGGGQVQLVARPLGELGALFPAPGTSLRSRKERAAYQRDQTEARIKQILAQVEPASEPTLVIIELPNYQAPQLRREFGLRDPQRALRQGLARTGRITKFFTGATEEKRRDDPDDLRHVCTGTALDGLRQLGYLPAPIGFEFPKENGFPKDLLVVALWMVRLSQKRGFLRVHLPVVVLFHTSRRQVRAWLPDGKGIRSYAQALLDITTLAPEVIRRNNQGKALQQFGQLLNSLPDEGAPDVLLLAEAQNIRQTLTGFQNPAIALDTWHASSEDEPISIEALPGRLRVARLRSNLRGETPEWFSPGASAGQGYVQGVWQLPGLPRVFYNIAEKPVTMGGRRQGKQVRPQEYYAIPSIQEIVLQALQPGDVPEQWALAIDQWRRMGYLTESMTRLPLPLQWAEHMDRYAEVIGPWVFEDQWGAERDEEEEEEDKPVQLELFAE